MYTLLIEFIPMDKRIKVEVKVNLFSLKRYYPSDMDITQPRECQGVARDLNARPQTESVAIQEESMKYLGSSIPTQAE